MFDNKGKMTITSLILILLIIFGAFALFKELMILGKEKTIQKEIKDTFGAIRGAAFTRERGLNAIYDILDRNGISESHIDDVFLEISDRRIKYSVSFRIESDLIIMKRVKEILIEDEMESMR